MPKVRPGFFWLGLAQLLASGQSWHITSGAVLKHQKCKVQCHIISVAMVGWGSLFKWRISYTSETHSPPPPLSGWKAKVRGESVADISDVLLHTNHVSKEWLKVKKGHVQGVDALIASFSKFDKDHPNFIINSNLGEQTVISVQTNFMWSQLLKDQPLEGPINGIVNDAAHGWWREQNSLLVVSSVYCPNLPISSVGSWAYSLIQTVWVLHILNTTFLLFLWALLTRPSCRVLF